MILSNSVPPLTEAVKRKFLRSYPSTRKLTRESFNLFGMHYSSPDVRKLSIIDEKGRPIEYGINYNPNDISTIAIFKDGLWVADGRANELKLADGTYQHLSLWERKIAQELANDNNNNPRDWLQFLGGVAELNMTRAYEKRNRQREVEKGRNSTLTPLGCPGATAVKTTADAVRVVADAASHPVEGGQFDYTKNLINFGAGSIQN